jgi:hypothetical protein
MLMDLGEKLIDELRIQSQRDLNAAERILDGGGHMEHVAWHCEQSYEKIVKFIYAYFKLKILNGNEKSVYEKMYEKQHYGSYKLVTNMLREITGSFRSYLKNTFQKIDTNPQEIPIQTFNVLVNLAKNIVPTLNKQLENSVSNTESTIEKYISDINAFKNFLNNATAQNLSKAIEAIDVTRVVPTALNQISESKLMSGDQLFDEYVKIAISNPNEYQKFYGFISKALILAIWTLPHTSMSRYPILGHNFENLTAYRNRDVTLGPFFKMLIKEIKNMELDTGNFLGMLQQYKKTGIIQ